MSSESETRTMRELRAIIQRDHSRFSELAEAWNELTDEAQDELLALAAKWRIALDRRDSVSA